MLSSRQNDIYDRSHKRSRSASPSRPAPNKRHRSHSPPHKSRHRHHHHHAKPSNPKALPYDRPTLHKHDLKPYEALFAEYLGVQKNLEIRNLEWDEVKGRWKSFIGKWNRGELAEGWYDPAFGQRCEERYAEGDNGEQEKEEEIGQKRSVKRKQEGDAEGEVEMGVVSRHADVENKDEDDDEDDGYGPAPLHAGHGRSQGPAIPGVQDLQERRERLDDDHDIQRADLRYERRQERRVQKDRDEELVPRAEPGTRERQLEKKREVTASNRAFKDAKEAGDVEVKDGELMGDDGVDAFKAEKKKRERVKNEREIRKEENLRARAVEREERMAQMRGKEEKTMDMLRGLAARFG